MLAIKFQGLIGLLTNISVDVDYRINKTTRQPAIRHIHMVGLGERHPRSRCWSDWRLFNGTTVVFGGS